MEEPGIAPSAPIESGIIESILPPSYNQHHEDTTNGGPPLPPRIDSVMHIEDASPNGSNASVYQIPDEGEDSQPPYNVYDDMINAYLRREGAPPVLMPVRGGYYESYLSPLLTILYYIPDLRKAVFHHEFRSLGYEPRWFRGDPVKVPSEITEVDIDGVTHDLRFLLEVQRVFAFMDDSSSRSFASLSNFVKSFPKIAQQAFGEVDNLSDAYEVFYRTLSKQLSLTGVERPLQLFQSTLCDAPSDEYRDFGLFQIDPEDVKRTLYKTLHSLIWSDWLDTSQSISSLSDTVVVSLEPCIDEMVVPTGFEIPQKFYPQIYTTEFQPIVQEVKQTNDEIEKERAELNKKLMKLKTHKGKHIQSLLDHSLEFLTEEVQADAFSELNIKDALADVQSLKLDIQQQRAELVEMNNKLIDERHKKSIHNVPYLLERYAETHHDVNPEPYILTGVILRSTNYCFLDKKDEGAQWSYIEHTQPTDIDTNFEIGALEFDDIKRGVHSHTQSKWKDPIVFVYTKESKFMDQTEVALPESVKKFLELDRDELEKSTEWVLDSDGLSTTDPEIGEPDLSTSEEEEQLIALSSDEEENGEGTKESDEH
jgi:hypothetical protein